MAAYKRVLIKLSGEMLRSTDCKEPISKEHLQLVATQVKAVYDAGVQVAVVVGGGNIVRGAQASESSQIDRVTGDHMGMLATIINSLALQDALEKMGPEVRVMSSIEMNRLAEPYIQRRAVHHLNKGRIIFLAAGSGNPYSSTDTAAALRGSEIGAEVLIKATKVDGIYSADPMKDSTASKYEQVSFDDVIQKRLAVLDATAFTMCRENDLPILVCNLLDGQSLLKAAMGEAVGTVVK